jgi:hypothetical protein
VLLGGVPEHGQQLGGGDTPLPGPRPAGQRQRPLVGPDQPPVGVDGAAGRGPVVAVQAERDVQETPAEGLQQRAAHIVGEVEDRLDQRGRLGEHPAVVRLVRPWRVRFRGLLVVR